MNVPIVGKRKIKMVDKSKRKTICQHCMKIIPDNQKCSCRKQVVKEQRQQFKENNTDMIKLIKSTRWQKFRLRIINRDGGHCQRCLHKYKVVNSKSLEVHHIKPRTKYPELMFEETNVVTLCKLCNTQIGTKETLDFAWTKPEEPDYVL